ncbi:hypothetical protein EXE46_12370 [Halorubrum sp. GN11_10-6_MGM]|uniref:hypothetical protein n=1 Tax=Halorubrum sp. GN11_10-6_MGM TaxID=2518112 RepID=UPI0010F6B670|nr:hypothetical protein [Halorubrum sp. GN11_10-6_MGM]TKX73817.1 hypothetical protein EXE46_12370 [Halorubrum sp. GN11_10-6_MGM]
MLGFPSPFGSADDDLFDGYDEFVADDLPRPGAFLDGHDVLTGTDHLAFHRLTRDCFEERGVYDMTFDYNLARLNLDTRHGDAGFRYAVERGDAVDAVAPADADSHAFDGNGVDRVLRAEFTPTTAFCPQTHTLTVGAFRAWNGLSDRHEYDLVRVRAPPAHNRSEAVNERLAELEATYLETGEVAAESDELAAGTDEIAAESDGLAAGTESETEENLGMGSAPMEGDGDASARDRSTDSPF